MDIYSKMSPNDIPMYTIGDAAQYLRIPKPTIRSWIIGRSYPVKEGKKFFEPLIKPAGKEDDTNLLSFTNLIELHVLDSIRRKYGLAMNKIRQALEYVLNFGVMEHPLANKTFETDGVGLFVTEFGKLISASSSGQMEMREMIKIYLKRIERDESGIASRLYPFTRNRRTKNEPRLIVIDPKISFGRPVLTGTGIPIDSVVERFNAGEKLESISCDFKCKSEFIEEAIRYTRPQAA